MRNDIISTTLFVTDLDGTLFSSSPELSPKCKKHIEILSEFGVMLTYSTARTYRTVEKILQDVPVRLPVSLMNGVMIRDIKSAKNAVVHSIPDKSVPIVAGVFRKCGVLPLVYRVKDGGLLTYYSEPQNEYVKKFISERKEKFGKPFIETDNDSLLSSETEEYGEIIYFCAMTDGIKARELYDSLSHVDAVISTAYKDNYSESWYVEVFSPEASKKNAVNYLKRIAGASRLVTFGDNLNDLSMFEVSDLCYAPIGSAEETIKSASGVVRSPDECGVTAKIAELCKIELPD